MRIIHPAAAAAPSRMLHLLCAPARAVRREAATSFRSEAQEKRIAKKAEGLARKAEKKRRQEAERERKRRALPPLHALGSFSTSKGTRVCAVFHAANEMLRHGA